MSQDLAALLDKHAVLPKTLPEKRASDVDLALARARGEAMRRESKPSGATRERRDVDRRQPRCSLCGATGHRAKPHESRVAHDKRIAKTIQKRVQDEFADLSFVAESRDLAIGVDVGTGQDETVAYVIDRETKEKVVGDASKVDSTNCARCSLPDHAEADHYPRRGELPLEYYARLEAIWNRALSRT